MQDKEQLLRYLKKGIDALLEQDSFDGGQDFRNTQEQALKAYKKYLNKRSLTTEEKLKGFFEIPTGVGKTAVFVGIVAAAHWAAKRDGKELKTAIVVPTVQLLEQTEEALQTFAPQLEGKIGLYGDGKKNLKLPITVMTYNAWYDLSQSGRIGSHNIDLLISDEAHRGTSERRIENIAGAFNGETVQLAFTATAHFDEEKSVEQSHERQIFYKSIADAVREGELASYVQSQRLVIRVEPDEFMLSDEFQQASDQRRIAYRQKAKQNAWNKRALKIFRDGLDQRTQEPLSDNQAGFFVEGTKQADKLADMLNDDPVLAAKAKAMGYKGVAVAIHSGVKPRSEIKRRYEAYKNGEYLAVVGDEMFKEGFDHPPMKTLIDCPHASVVDKAQILGRGLRKWWNDIKARWEGLTVIDTVIYIGDEDPQENEKLRARALREAVSVKSVLEEDHVLSPFAPSPTEPAKPSEGNGGEGVFDDDPDVEEYSTIEDVYELDGEVSKLRKDDWIELTDEMVERVQSLRKETDVAAQTLLQQFADSPEGLTTNKISALLRGKANKISREYWEWLIEKWSSLPKVTFEERINISDEMYEQLLALKEQTQVGAIELISLENDVPEGLTPPLIQSWLNKTAKTAKKQYWDYVISKYEQSDTVVISDEIRAKLRYYSKSTGLGVDALLNNQSDVPSDLTRNMVFFWLSEKGATQTAKKAHLDYVLKKFETCGCVALTDEMVQSLKKEKDRTGVGARKITRLAQKLPDDFEYSKIDRWLSGKARFVIKSEWESVISAYGKQPSISKRIEITPEKRSALKQHFERTQVGAVNLLKNSDRPEGLTVHTVNTWLSDGAKSSKTALKTYWDYVISKYEEIPDAKIEERVQLTPDTKSKIKSLIEKTGVGCHTLLKISDDVPDGLNASLMAGWITNNTTTARKDYFDWAIKAWKECGYTALSDLDHSEAQSLKQKANIGAISLLKTSEQVPEGLTLGIVGGIFSGKTKSVKKEYYDWVISTLKDKVTERTRLNQKFSNG